MRRQLAYLWYVVRHKWYVWKAGLVTGAPIWRILIHDWSKFRKSEWRPYSERFYNLDGSSRTIPRKRKDQTPEEILVMARFRHAFQLHYKRNKHHWHYWVCFRGDNQDLYALEMPDKYITEMVADWAGAGKAITGKWDVVDWWKENRSKMILHYRTRCKVKKLIKQIDDL